MSDVRWLAREGIVGRPDEGTPPGPTPPPILDELFPLPTRPVFYPRVIPDDLLQKGENGISSTDEQAALPTSAERRSDFSRDWHREANDGPEANDGGDANDTNTGRDASGRREANGGNGASSGSQTREVIPTPAPLPPEDPLQVPGSEPSGSSTVRPQVWDSAGWRGMGGVGPVGATDGRAAPGVVGSGGTAVRSRQDTAWVFLPASPFQFADPKVIVPGDSSSSGNRQQRTARR